MSKASGGYMCTSAEIISNYKKYPHKMNSMVTKVHLFFPSLTYQINWIKLNIF